MAILLPLLSFGQEIKFMGLALGTDVDAFCKKLKEKGLKQTVDRFENKEFEGTFATYPNCRIIVSATEVSKKVKSVEVIFESVRNKKEQRDHVYLEVLKQYKNKYGDKLKREPYDKTKNDFLGIKTWSIIEGDLQIHIHKIGPSVLSPDECSLSVLYMSESLRMLKELNPNNHSDDI